MFLSVIVIIQRLYVIEQLINNTRAEHAPTGKPTGGGTFCCKPGKADVFPAEQEAWRDITQDLREDTM